MMTNFHESTTIGSFAVEPQTTVQDLMDQISEKDAQRPWELYYNASKMSPDQLISRYIKDEEHHKMIRLYQTRCRGREERGG